MFLEKLDLLMEQKGINKNILAKESGVPYTTIDGFYKKGYENAKLSTLKKLCLYFNVTLDYLMDDSVTETKNPKDETIQERPKTIAAHYDGEDILAGISEEEMKDILEFIKFKKAQRK